VRLFFPVLLFVGTLAAGAAAPALALPEGRAYEMVTPNNKEGNPVFPEIFPAAGTGEGELVAFTSPGAFAGSSIGSSYDDYLAQRGSEMWDTSPVGVPTSEESTPDTFALATGFADFTPDLSESLSYVENAPNIGSALGHAATTVFYLRQPDGSFIHASPLLKTVSGKPVTGVEYEGASPDFSHLVFAISSDESSERALLPSDTTEDTQALYEISGIGGPSPVLRLLDVNDEGRVIDPYCPAELGGSTAFHAISNNGSKIFFTANTNLAARGACDFTFGQLGEFPENPAMLFVRVNDSKTLEVSKPIPAQCTEAPCTTAEQTSAVFQGASEDGSKAFFTTILPLVNGDKDGTNDLYEAVIEGEAVKELIQVSKGEGPTPGTGAEVQGVVRISDDGSHVYFVAKGVLTEGKNVEGNEPLKGADNMYVYDTVTQKTTYVAELCSGKEESGSVSGVVKCPSSGSDFEQLWMLEGERSDLHEAQDTQDGQFLVLSSFSQLTPDDTNSGKNVYEYDALTGRLVLVSVGEDGYGENGTNDSFNASIAAPEFDHAKVTDQDESSRRAVSEDGSTVVFSTAHALSLQAINGQPDIYEWHDGQVGLISDGHSPQPDENPVITSSGHDIFFATTESLVLQDTDGVLDIYDARIGGGFPVSSVPAAGCSGDTCQGPPNVPSLLGAPASATFSGLGNPTPSVLKSAVKNKPIKKHKPKRLKKKGLKKKRKSMKKAKRNGSTSIKSIRRGG
jgi:hypothetical protein